MQHSKLRPWAMAAAVLFALSSVGATTTRAEAGTIHLNISKVGVVVGVDGGSGILTFNGHHYRLTLGGIRAGTIRVSGAELIGTVSRLGRSEDIAGIYTVASASVEVAGGGKVATLKNSKA